MSRSPILGRGRHEPNKPRVSSTVLSNVVSNVVRGLGVDFPASNGSYQLDCLKLFNVLVRLAPALVISSSQPLVIKGLCSFRLIHTKAGKKRLKATFSSSVFKYLDSVFNPPLPPEAVINDLLAIGKSDDLSVEVARYEY